VRVSPIVTTCSAPSRPRAERREARRAEDGDEELDLGHLAGLRIDDARLVTRIVGEELLARAMDLSHRELLPRVPRAVVPAERRVAKAVGVLHDGAKFAVELAGGAATTLRRRYVFLDDVQPRA
jgi:hypothetical protein